MVSLEPKPRPGRKRRLTAQEEQEVFRWVVGGDPRQLGLDFGLWTRKIISEQIETRLGVKLSITSVGELLHRLGMSVQKPLRRAYERNEEGIREWVHTTHPTIRAKAKRSDAEIFWLDEAGVRSDDPLQRTWGLIGKTPNVKTSGQRQSINVISAISNNGGFWLTTYTGTLNAERILGFLDEFMKYRRRPVVLILDGHPGHKATSVLRHVETFENRLRLAFLPPYAPEHNPDEYVFHDMKSQGATKKPLKQGESLRSRVESDLRSLKNDKPLLKSFFRAEKVTFAST